MKDFIDPRAKEQEASEQLVEEEDVFSKEVSGHYTRVDRPGLLRRVLFGDDADSFVGQSYSWDDLWSTYECFISDTEHVLESYGEDFQSREPYLEVKREDNLEGIRSREEALQLENSENLGSPDLEPHQWSWEPTEGVSFSINYYDGRGRSGRSVYEQVGVDLEVEEKGNMLVNDLVEVMESWFGEDTSYKYKSSVSGGTL